jgi:hypothetical protein
MTTWGTREYQTLLELLGANLRLPATTSTNGGGTVIFTFVPALSPAEQVIFDDLSLMVRFGVTLTLAEWQSIKADAANLKTYLGVATPTLVQTAAATKAIIRVLGTIIRS